ncbi:hydrolase 1, exosortase A system-associated [Paremcibacter congregatus]|uniref:Hydrolase 1, exosortase A system-associated n=1 Tax=Paremcibacter congregatus TaxID=2043170 RepID=A0A2G4YX77_9PROT|nr:hydrolase 1, exosortase A system-associated [Paremcibacter congregatus]PHZ86046.1 hydrolase 1, exosortase A system-associated [Paremcibacter congregatus]QDE27012.1 hydrolase 1, exosortase A system-associated [Paremcibacter congregatus]
MTIKETTFTFSNPQDHQMIGILHHPDTLSGTVGLLVVVGGPQYRIGAHRQYVHMARHAAREGIPAMRFDYSGVGDSQGTYPGFEQVAPDIHSAIDAFLHQCPQIKTVALWGLCEGASALLLGGAAHPAVSHIVLANPWVRSDSGLAKAYVKHYYWDRLKSPDLWRKVFSGGLNLKAAFSGLWDNVQKAFLPQKNIDDNSSSSKQPDTRPFPDRMQTGLAAFSGKSLLIQSGNDLTAREFDDLINSDTQWKETIALKINQRIDIADTDHTFSCEKWRAEVAKSTANWLKSSP